MTATSAQKKILVVDDSLTVRKVAEKTLISAGYAVFLADSGEAGLSEAIRTRPDLILLDYTLGDEVAADVCRSFSSREGLSKTPIVLMTAKGNAAREIQRGVATVAGVLSKPFVKDTLLAMVEQCVLEAGKAAEESNSLQFLEKEIQRVASSETQGSWDPQALAVRKVAEAIATQLRDNISLVLRDSNHLSRDKLARAMTAKLLDSEVIASLAKKVHEILVGESRQGFVASAKTISLPDLLQSIANSHLTGVLTVLSTENVIELHFGEGVVRFLSPRKIGLRCSPTTIYCNRSCLPMEYVREALLKTETEENSIFLKMVQDCILTADDASDAIVSLGLEVLGECVFDQDSCWFQFKPKPKVDSGFLELGVNITVQRLLLRLFSQIDEWKLMEREVYDPKILFIRAPDPASAAKQTLTEKQILMLAALRGTQRISELVASCRLSPLEVCRGLFHLLKSGLVLKIQEEPACAANGSCSR